jgi:hypothetical protein
MEQVNKRDFRLGGTGEVLILVVMKFAVFWDVTPCSLVENDLRNSLPIRLIHVEFTLGSGTRTGSSASTSVFPRRNHTTNPAYSIIHPSPTLYNLTSRCHYYTCNTFFSLSRTPFQRSLLFLCPVAQHVPTK